jgi:hypothetical protein
MEALMQKMAALEEQNAALLTLIKGEEDTILRDVEGIDHVV